MYIQKKPSRPLMAVLVSSKSISGFHNQIAGSWIRPMVKANKEVKNILYFFSLREVRLKERKITGYYWHGKKKRWAYQDFFLPDVLYIKCRIDKDYTSTFAALCDTIIKNDGELITHDRFNKWQLYQILSKDPGISSYLPVTRTVKRPEDIQQMLQQFNVVYLKSHIGKMGENVLRVEVLPEGNYRYSFFKHDQLSVRKLPGFPALLHIVKRFFRGEKFLIQQGIELLKFKNRLIDMRAELTHNGNGNLDIVGISVRYGKPGSPITTHGNAIKFDDFFVKNMGYSKGQLEKIRSVAKDFLFLVYEYIENHYDKYAELGIDFAIDTHNKIWFIEANSRSTKASLKKAYGKAVLYRYNKNILEYARYLYDRTKSPAY